MIIMIKLLTENRIKYLHIFKRFVIIQHCGSTALIVLWPASPHPTTRTQLILFVLAITADFFTSAVHLRVGLPLSVVQGSSGSALS